jgi:hypothetical protein
MQYRCWRVLAPAIVLVLTVTRCARPSESQRVADRFMEL